MTLDYVNRFFFPKSLEAKNARLKEAKAMEDFHIVARIDSSWIDLRAAYAQTINKSQGSTYDRVYIDLDDLRRCNSGDQIARMLYVGVSRARLQVFMTGDFT
jgi:ATP-dependent exoDNAse (exonuclease V) alpha subunit